MSKNNLFIEKRPDGQFAVLQPDAKRASALVPTQREAIERAKSINPDAAIHVERVRHVPGGSPDKWRKL